jgi:hypothetical protein
MTLRCAECTAAAAAAAAARRGRSGSCRDAPAATCEAGQGSVVAARRNGAGPPQPQPQPQPQVWSPPRAMRSSCVARYFQSGLACRAARRLRGARHLHSVRAAECCSAHICAGIRPHLRRDSAASGCSRSRSSSPASRCARARARTHLSTRARARTHLSTHASTHTHALACAGAAAGTTARHATAGPPSGRCRTAPTPTPPAPTSGAAPLREAATQSLALSQWPFRACTASVSVSVRASHALVPVRRTCLAGAVRAATLLRGGRRRHRHHRHRRHRQQRHRWWESPRNPPTKVPTHQPLNPMRAYAHEHARSRRACPPRR